MARSIAVIHSEILSTIAADPRLVQLNSTSSTAIYRLFAYVVAVAIATLENLFDAHRTAVLDDLAAQMPHTLRYYQGKALAFQLGDDLVPGTTRYEVVSEDRLVAFASVREAGETLEVKVAKENIEPLTAAELAAFSDYMNEVKDAGVRLDVSSTPADRLRVTLDVRYNPQILDNAGRRLDGEDDEVVVNAVRRYTERLRFDGQFVTANLVDELQRTEGIQVPTVRSLSIAAAGDPAFVTVDEVYFPGSGFVRLYSSDDLIVNYIPYADA